MHVLLACTLNLTNSLKCKNLRLKYFFFCQKIQKIFLSHFKKKNIFHLLTQVIITDQILTNLINHEDSGEQFFF